MPFKSEAQRRFLWMKHPKIAEAWAHGKSSKTGRKEKKFNGGAYESARKKHFGLKK
jgi:hypothetical protein